MTDILINPFGWDLHEAGPPSPWPTESSQPPSHLSLEFSEFSQGPPRSWTLLTQGTTNIPNLEARGDWYGWLESLDFPREEEMNFDADGEFRHTLHQFGTHCALVYRRGRGKRVKNRSLQPLGAS